MLDESWLNIVLQRLELAYAGRFPPRGVNVALLRAEWQRELSGMTREQLQHAMANLPPDYPPNVLQFRAICASHRPPVVVGKAQPTEPPKPETVAMMKAFAEGLQKAAGGKADRDPLRWAKRLKEREEAGHGLTRVQAQAWREALGRILRVEATQEEGGDDVPGQ